MSSIYLATVQQNNSSIEPTPNGSEIIDEPALAPRREASESSEPSFTKLKIYASSDGTSANSHLVKLVLK